MLLPEKLKKLREVAKVPQRKIAAALDIDTATYSKIENGKYIPSREHVIIIAEIFSYDKDDLIKLWLADKVVAIAKDDVESIPDALKLVTDRINSEK
jgi:transcriptional regulator with XRE-family HTH domain